MQKDNRLTQEIDNLVQGTYSPNEPGAAVIVVKNGEIIYRQGQGMANVELGVPIDPDMVFRLASITKQFTAVAILILAEQAKLAVDDPITKYLPDYPTHDHLITIRHLLTHTSGIMNCTEMPEFLSLQRKDLSVPELIDSFKHQPMQFAPGKRWSYSNSGYILLGAIIEKISGQTYEEFIRESIFTPLGMKDSSYDTPLKIMPRRVAGYDKGPDGYTNSAYLSMTQPYAAGSLASTVDDLAIWDAALYTDKLLKRETLKQAFTPFQLADGSLTMYGFGWRLSEYEGHQMIQHSGGINGFRTHALRMPEDRVFVAVLSNNTEKDPEILSFKISAITIGHPYQEPIPIELDIEVLSKFAGVYQINDAEERHIILEDNRLYSQRGEGARMEIVPFADKKFFFKNFSITHLNFVSGENGEINAVELQQMHSGNTELALRKDTKTK
ncbi:MAG: beta-lactamase family protein [Ardenticatenaceae bacterium]|nr:beta-lactamase family protein [Ardenticatenaceae bacterium]